MAYNNFLFKYLLLFDCGIILAGIKLLFCLLFTQSRYADMQLLVTNYTWFKRYLVTLAASKCREVGKSSQFNNLDLNLYCI